MESVVTRQLALVVVMALTVSACKGKTDIDARASVGDTPAPVADPPPSMPPPPANNAPTANDLTGAGFSGNADVIFATASVLDGAADADGDALTLSGFDASGLAGVLASNGDGTFNYDPRAAFQGLAAGETVTETFTYTVSDGTDTATGTVTLTVTGVNDAPVAVADAATTDEDLAVTINVLANDTDVDAGDSLDVISVQIDTAAANGSAAAQADGTVLYTPDAGFFGTDTFGYSVADAAGLRSNTATVTVTVTEIGELPVAADDAVSTDEDTVLNGDLFADNGSGADSDADSAFTVSAVNGNAGDVGSSLTLASGALLQVGSDGTFSYDPNGQFDFLPGGQRQDSFDYEISDGTSTDTATVTVTVNGVNDAPTIVINSGARLANAATIAVDDTVISGADVDHSNPATLSFDVVDAGRCGDFLDAADATITQFTQADLETAGAVRYTERRCNPGQFDTVSLTLTDPAGGQVAFDFSTEVFGFRVARSTSPAQNSELLPAATSVVANVVDGDNNAATLDAATVNTINVAAFAGFNGARTARTAAATATDQMTMTVNEDLLAGEWLRTTFGSGIQDAGGNALAPFVLRQRAATTGVSTGTMTSTLVDTSGRNRMAAGDLDGDGDIDLVEQSNARLFTNNGSGAFTVTSIAGFPGHDAGDPIEMADMDGDGDLDLIQLRNRVITILSNDGAANFTAVVPPVINGATSQSSTADNLVLDDLDGDGDIDMAVFMYNTPDSFETMRVYLNNGTGQLAVHPDQSFFLATQLGYRALQSGDLDNDGDIDLVTSAAGPSNPAIVFLNAGDGTYFQDSTVAIQTGCFRCNAHTVLGDVDGDGDLDIIGAVEADRNGAGSFTGYTPNRIFINDGNANFSASPLQPTFGSNGAVGGRMADIDGDGDIDFLSLGAGNFDSNPQRVDVYANDGTGQFSLISRFGSDTPGRDALTLADLDGDGDLDAAFGNDNPFGAILIYQNN